jgi:glucosamine--fructose-6-phosphate aminotransferase (isomerizing)
MNLIFPFAQEISIAQTRAFSTLYLGTVFLASIWAGRPDLLSEMERVPEAGSRLLESCADKAGQLGRESVFDRYYFLGSGPRYGLACEISLKMKEMSLSHSEPFHFLEFRHGPQSMANETTLIVALLSDRNRFQEEQVLAEMEKRGVRVYRMAENGVECSFDSGISEQVRNVLYLPVGQVLAFEHAICRGLDPDHPHNLEAVVTLNTTNIN